MSTQVKFVKGNIQGDNSTYNRQGTGNIEFDSAKKEILLDGVPYSKTSFTETDPTVPSWAKTASSPSIPGSPTTTTQTTGDNSTKIATTAFVQQELSNFDDEIFVPVSTLPTTNIQTNKIYIVPNSLAAPENNLYDEYIYKNNAWELIGTSQIDLRLASSYEKSSANYPEPQANDSLETAISKLHAYVEQVDDRISDVKYQVTLSGNGLSAETYTEYKNHLPQYAREEDLNDLINLLVDLETNGGAETTGILSEDAIKAFNTVTGELDAEGVYPLINDAEPILKDIPVKDRVNVVDELKNKQDKQFIVYVHGQGSDLYVNETFANTYDAYTEGKNVIFKLDNGTILPMTGISGNSASGLIMGSIAHPNGNIILMFGSDETITVNTINTVNPTLKTINNESLVGSGNLQLTKYVSYTNKTAMNTDSSQIDGTIGFESDKEIYHIWNTTNQEWLPLTHLNGSNVTYNGSGNGILNSGDNINISLDNLDTALQSKQNSLNAITTSDITTGTDTTQKTISAKTLRDNFYTESEIDNKLPLIVNLVDAPDDTTGVFDKSQKDINAAYTAGRRILLIDDSGEIYEHCILVKGTSLNVYPIVYKFMINRLTSKLSIRKWIFASITASEDNMNATYQEDIILESKYNVTKVNTTNPLNPVTGASYFNTTYNKLLIYNGTTWVDVMGNDPTATNYVYTQNS